MTDFIRSKIFRSADKPINDTGRSFRDRNQTGRRSRLRDAAAGVLVLLLAAGLCACSGGGKVTGSTKPPVILNPHGTPGNAAETDGLPETKTPADETPDPSEVPVVSETFPFTGGAYCILDAKTGGVVLARNADEQMYIASITKLLTALVAVDYFGMEETITVESGYLDLIRANPDIDAYGMREGQSYLVADLMKMLLLRSYGDAALALQYGTEERTGQNFLDLMNEKAAEIGMSKSHFDNPIGLDTGNNFHENYSTAWDAAKLMLAAYRNETVLSVCSLRTATLSFGKEISNTNALMGDSYASDQYKVIGGKTGSTKAAGYNVACAAKESNGESTYIIVYLHGSSAATLYGEMAEMLKTLF